MMRTTTRTLLLGLALASVSADQANALLIEDFTAFGTNAVSHLAGSSFVTNGALQVTLTPRSPYPHVLITRALDLGQYQRIDAEIKNLGAKGITVAARVDNAGATGSANQSTGSVTLDPGATGILSVRFNRDSPNGFREKLKGMHGYPDGTEYGAAMDPSKIVSIQFFGNRPTEPMHFTINRISAEGHFDPKQLEVPQPFYPFIDELGQYKHGEWPGKTHGIADLEAQREREAADLAQHPAPADRDEFGGWKEGPQLEATGHFRTVKHEGRWWFVTPNGHLFWSLGADCVRTGGITFVEERDGWFENLPGEDSELKRFYGMSKAGQGDYKGREMKSFDVGSANAWRMYGDDWAKEVRDIAHRRISSWGFNTLGCWSDKKIAGMGKTPYVDWVFYTPPRIRSWGIVRKLFPDVFDPRFEAEFRRRAQSMLADSKDDPFCIGYFSDNELSWDDDTTLARVVLKADADQVAKQRMVEWLTARYNNDISALNAAWKTAYTNWSGLLPPQAIYPAAGTTKDLVDFTEVVARTYFSTCKRVLSEVAPNKLYLGCRFATYNTRLVQIAAEYCDVVSFNIYRDAVAAWPVPGGVDKPILIGEFHFGAKDRGVFGDGLVGVANQQERAAAVRRYVSGAAAHPNFVGAHWFQYVDEPASGRALEGENHQIGLVDICDTPNGETIAAFREVGKALYKIRSGRGVE